MDTLSVATGALAPACRNALDRLAQKGFPAALWNRSLDIWGDDPEARASIANRLGWLGALDFLAPEIDRLKRFAAGVRQDGFTDVVLLGMGGSSLAPEVLRRVLGVAPGFPRFRMLDSTDPDAVRAAMDRAATSLFIFASKSGSTIEPNVMAAEAKRRVIAEGHAHWGSRFVAITDEGTEAHRRATTERFRDVFINPSDIGGRYSALSFFGMVPAALMGADLDRIVALAREMEAACRTDDLQRNPGLTLGALIAAGAENGRDKLTLLLPERLASLGLWVEQLVAESTGKEGVGVVPIAGEPLTTTLGPDRIAVAVTLDGSDGDEHRAIGQAAATVPAAHLELPGVDAIGAEFLRWEVATTVAGLLLGINPFDEPNVQQAKVATNALLDTWSSQGRLPMPEAHASVDRATLSLSGSAQGALQGGDALSFLRTATTGDYVCLLAYLPPDDASLEALLVEFRTAVAAATGCATMFGYGPRYLHSTGQLHKGGPNTGVFIVLTADPSEDLAIPDRAYSFGVLEMAQAIGDFRSLEAEGRRALFVHLPSRRPDLLRRVSSAICNGRM